MNIGGSQLEVSWSVSNLFAFLSDWASTSYSLQERKQLKYDVKWQNKLLKVC